MNNPFALHGIEHLSPSSLNCWRSAPGVWALRYLANVRDGGNAAMWRGSSVEAGLAAFLRGTNLDKSIEAATQAFDLNSKGELTDELEAERDLIKPMVEQCALWKPPADLLATQLRVEYWFESVPVPVVGFLDMSFEDGTDIDLKTTKACPSSPRPDHVRQVSLYRASRNRKGGILYVTGKRHAYFDVDDDMMARGLSDLESDAISLMHFLSRSPDRWSAIRSLPMDTDSYLFPKLKVPLSEILTAG